MKMRVVLFEKPNTQTKAHNRERARERQKQTGVKRQKTQNAGLVRIDVKKHQKPGNPA